MLYTPSRAELRGRYVRPYAGSRAVVSSVKLQRDSVLGGIDGFSCRADVMEVAECNQALRSTSGDVQEDLAVLR